ncbi:MAG TPA: Hsp20/alpha crystallin family protein [Acidimicrobiales bacterium]|jgi:HSP20 family protein|nr:Hsp20/alpha crystallin family protein [Acidimicrobiales bacterium]
MALMRRERFDFPDLFQVGFPELFRRFADVDPQGGWMRVEQFTEDDTLVVRAELPDIDPDKDLELTVADGMLHISAHREEKTETQEKEFYRSEFRYGSFVRDLRLPEGTSDQDIAASYKDGILEVRVPLPEEPKGSATKVPVTHG